MESLNGNQNQMQETLDRIRKERELEMKMRAHFALPGSLGLPALLDDKRCKYGIPDSAWDDQPVFNKIFVWQLPIDEAGTYGGGLIVKTEERKARERSEAPRGVIVSAGLQALDELRSHGVDVGHTVFFTHLAPFRKRLPPIDGKEPALVILHAGDIICSAELAQGLKKRECRIVAREVEDDDGNVSVEHFYCDSKGKTWNPAQNVASEDG